MNKFHHMILHRVHNYSRQYPAAFPIAMTIILSWTYALCEQIAIPLPFTPVPLIILQVPLFYLSLTLGWQAVAAYVVYLAQGIAGAPFFAFGLGGMARFCGPTGGYLVGMFMAAAFLAATSNALSSSWRATLGKLWMANILMYGFGLAHLVRFVPTDKLLALGFYPFAFGGFGIKAGIIMAMWSVYKKKSHS